MQFPSRILSTLLLAHVLGLPAQALSFRVLAKYPIQEKLPGALDLRAVPGAEQRAVYVSDAREGTFRVPLIPGAEPKQVIPGRSDPAGFWYQALLGASPDYLAVSATIGGLTWKPLPDGPLAPPTGFVVVMDIDLYGDRLAILGGQRGPDGASAPDGAMAWIGSLSRDLADLRPIVHSTAQKGSPAMENCHHLYIGVVRFLRDGRLLVVPGVEGGARLFSTEGKLLRTWEAADLGIADGCGEAARHKYEYAAAWRPRYEGWLNRQRILDDVLPLRQGPGLVIRRVEGERTLWDLRMLDPETGAGKTFPLPIVADSPNVHLRGDVLGDRIVFLMRETRDLEAPAAVPSQILELEVLP